jgi:DNA replication licensing factor MCM2
MKMARRDRMERSGRRGQRAARRNRAPAFLGSDDVEDDDIMDDQLGISSMKRRTRKQYDERRDIDDLDGVEDVSFFFHITFCVFIANPYLRKFRWSN